MTVLHDVFSELAFKVEVNLGGFCGGLVLEVFLQDPASQHQTMNTGTGSSLPFIHHHSTPIPHARVIKDMSPKGEGWGKLPWEVQPHSDGLQPNSDGHAWICCMRRWFYLFKRIALSKLLLACTQDPEEQEGSIFLFVVSLRRLAHEVIEVP